MSKKVVYDASDEKQVHAAQAAERDFDRDLDYIIASERGRRWLYSLVFDDCHIRRPSHVPGDTHSTAYNEGARAVGERILENVRVRDFGKYMKMLEENHGDE